jgi:hypothetical protein
MKTRNVLLRSACIWIVLIGFGSPSHALDLTGAWATDASVCKKIFVKKGDNLSLTADSDVYGDGFIFEGNNLKGKIATCNIKSRREQGNIIHMIASCSQEVMVGMMQFSVRVDNDNQLTRIFVGDSDLDTAYFRCPSE